MRSEKLANNRMQLHPRPLTNSFFFYVRKGLYVFATSGRHHELEVRTISGSLPTIRRDEKVEYFHYTMLFTDPPYKRVRKARVHVRSWFMPFVIAALQCLRPLLKELRQKILLIYLEEAYHLLQGF